MPHRRVDRNPNGPERRAEYRREEDDEMHAIVDHAIEDAPIVRRVLKSGILQTGKIATACIAFGTVIGGAGATLGVRFVGPREDTRQLATRVEANTLGLKDQRHQFDSLLTEIREMKTDIKTLSSLSCVTARKANPDIAAAAGCPDAQPRTHQ